MRALLTLLLVALLAPAASAQGDEGTRMVEIKVDQDLAIKDFLTQISLATGKPMLFDPNGQRIRGQKMGAGFSLKVPKERAFDTFRAILAFYELTMIPVGPSGYEVYLVVDSRSTNNFVKNKAVNVPYADIEKYADHDGMYVSCAIPVEHIENLTTLRTALSTMVSPAGIGRVHEVPGSGSIVVMDFAPTVAAMARLIKHMDVKREAREEALEVIELDHGEAVEMAAAIADVIQQPVAAPAPTRGRPVSQGTVKAPLRVRAYAPRNAIIVSGTKEGVARVKALVATLDRPAPSAKVEVIRLKNAKASALSYTLSAIFSEGARIVADQPTNSLVVAASPEILQRLREVVKLLDEPPV